jgi:copper chaperone NosL
MRTTALLAAAMLAAACAPAPAPVLYGSEACEQCRMTVSEPGFAARALERTGRAYAFDSIECLADWLGARGPDARPLHSLWVQDFAGGERWLRAEEAAYVRGGEVRSPMGAALTAHAGAVEARAHADEHGGEVLEWGGVRTLAAVGGRHEHAH